jgi:hypothetical protein
MVFFYSGALVIRVLYRLGRLNTFTVSRAWERAITYISIGLNIVGVIFPEIKGMLAILEIILIAVYGLLYLYLGRIILRCDNELFGYRKYVAWLGIIEGACYLTIVLLPIAVLMSVVSGIITAKMFFASTRETAR